MWKSPSRIYSANFIRLARMPLIRIVCPRWHSPKIRRAPVSPAFVRRWEQHVIFSRCIVVSSLTKKSDANCSVWTSASSLLLQNCRESTQKKLRKHWPVKGRPRARGRCSQGERVLYGRDLCRSGGTGKAEAAKLPGAGIGPKQWKMRGRKRALIENQRESR